MKKLSVFSGGLLAGLLALSGVVHGETLEIAPSRAIVLPSDESGKTRIALYFDLSGLVSGEGRVLGSANLEWRLSGTSYWDDMDFEASAITASWTEESAATNAGAIMIAESPTAFWDITRLDNKRNGTGFVRLDLTDLVSSWADGAEENNGFIIASPDLGGLSLTGQLSSARLKIRYGFIR